MKAETVIARIKKCYNFEQVTAEIEQIEDDIRLARIAAGKMTVIKIATTVGLIEVDGIPFGNYVAVHQDTDTKTWSVSHIPSGRTFVSRITKTKAYKIARLLQADYGDAIAAEDVDVIREAMGTGMHTAIKEILDNG
jgi:hypothetical protein